MDTFGLKIISSDRVFYEGRCRKMIVPVPDGGGMEILPHHEDMVIAVVIGEAMLQFEEGEWVNLAVGAGFLEIVKNRRISMPDMPRSSWSMQKKSFARNRVYRNITGHRLRFQGR